MGIIDQKILAPAWAVKRKISESRPVTGRTGTLRTAQRGNPYGHLEPTSPISVPYLSRLDVFTRSVLGFGEKGTSFLVSQRRFDLAFPLYFSVDRTTSDYRYRGFDFIQAILFCQEDMKLW
jgi:hypothetical protein